MFVAINGEVDDVAAELKRFFLRVTVSLMLGDGVRDGLPGQTVLYFEGNDRSLARLGHPNRRTRQVAQGPCAGDRRNESTTAAIAMPTE